MTHRKNRTAKIFLAATVCWFTVAANAAAPTATNAVLMNCAIKPKSATVTANGSYMRAYKSALPSNQLITANQTVTSLLQRQKFTLVYKERSLTGRNGWYISNQIDGSCFTAKDRKIMPVTCRDQDYWFFRITSDGYYVISGLEDGQLSMYLDPNSANTSNETIRYSTADFPSTLNGHKFEIRDCTNQKGQYVSPTT